MLSNHTECRSLREQVEELLKLTATNMLTRSFYISLICIFFASGAKANCIAFTENERLANYCLLETISGKLVDENTAALVFKRLSLEGYFGGLPEALNQANIYPNLYYSDNINGGNPDKKLRLGDLEFDGEPDLVAKAGLVAGLTLSGSSRFTYGEGRYLNTSFSASQAYSPEHSLSYTRLNLQFCSKNKIGRDSHIDVCASSDKQNKEISSSDENSVTTSYSKMFLKAFGAVEIKVGLRRFITNGYEQNQLSLSSALIHSNKGFYSLGLTLGERVEDQLTMRYSINANAAKYYKGHKYNLSISHGFSDGGRFLGVDRNERSSSVVISTWIRENTSINIGYTNLRSSIDYFDHSYPIISLTQRW